MSEYEITYLFVDGIAERLRPGAKREPVLAAWGFTIRGRRVLLHMMAGSKEDAETVTAFFEDMKRRGLNDPLLVTSDGAPGIIKAIEICFPRAARQRCLAHRMRNLAVKVQEDVLPDFKVRAQAAYQAPSRAIARELAAGVDADYGRKYDSAVACFMDDFEACIAHLRFPVTHRRAIRTTNLLELLFVEKRRRLKIIPNAFGERAVLKLMFGALIRAAERWRSIKVTEFEHRQITSVKKELDQKCEVPSRSQNTTLNGCGPGENIQQISELTGANSSARLRALRSPSSAGPSSGTLPATKAGQLRNSSSSRALIRNRGVVFFWSGRKQARLRSDRRTPQSSRFTREDPGVFAGPARGLFFHRAQSGMPSLCLGCEGA